MLVLTNTLGLVVAIWMGGKGVTNLEPVFLTFSYYALGNPRDVGTSMAFIGISRMRSQKPGQFSTELMLDPPRVLDAKQPEAFRPADYDVELRGVQFRHSPSQPLLFDGLF